MVEVRLEIENGQKEHKIGSCTAYFPSVAGETSFHF